MARTKFTSPKLKPSSEPCTQSEAPSTQYKATPQALRRHTSIGSRRTADPFPGSHIKGASQSPQQVRSALDHVATGLKRRGTFAERGDSGSPVFTNGDKNKRKLIGLLRAGDGRKDPHQAEGTFQFLKKEVLILDAALACGADVKVSRKSCLSGCWHVLTTDQPTGRSHCSRSCNGHQHIRRADAVYTIDEED